MAFLWLINGGYSTLTKWDDPPSIIEPFPAEVKGGRVALEQRLFSILFGTRFSRGFVFSWEI